MYTPIMQTATSGPPDIRASEPFPLGEGVIDESTCRAIELESLFEALNSAKTVLGQAVLYRSLVQPLDSQHLIEAKQDSLKELEADGGLDEQLENLVNNAAAQERSYFDLIYGTFVGFFGRTANALEFEDYGYQEYLRGTRFVMGLCHDAWKLPDPQSSYLKDHVRSLREFVSTNEYALMKGPVYLTESGVMSKQQKKWWQPGLIFRPTLFKPLFILSIIGLIGLLVFLDPIGIFRVSISSIGIAFPVLIPALIFYVPMVGSFDRDSAIIPLRNVYKDSIDVQKVLEALGCIEELLVFNRFGKVFRQSTTLPKIIVSDNHAMVIKAGCNPILAKANPYYVPNDIKLDGKILTLISGPNSGGKTAFCKTLAQIQLLAQIGCYVPAETVELTIADRIFYQIPEVSHLEHDGEGRFGTELKRTKQVFLNSSHRSLIILDELSEGTTYEEKLATSFNILEGLYKRGGSSILITHNHELIDRLMERGWGQALQVEFKGRDPSYRLIEGISRVSHADIVAKRLGFSKEDIDGYLADQGYTTAPANPKTTKDK